MCSFRSLNKKIQGSCLASPILCAFSCLPSLHIPPLLCFLLLLASSSGSSSSCFLFLLASTSLHPLEDIPTHCLCCLRLCCLHLQPPITNQLGGWGRGWPSPWPSGDACGSLQDLLGKTLSPVARTKHYGTGDSRVIPQHSTNPAQSSLTSEF